MSLSQRMSSPRILDDGTEVPPDDEFPVPSSPIEEGRWSALYSLEEEDRGYAIVTFDCYGRAMRPHPLEAGRYETPGAAFDAIRKWESGAMRKAVRSKVADVAVEDEVEDDVLTAEAEEQSA